MDSSNPFANAMSGLQYFPYNKQAAPVGPNSLSVGGFPQYQPAPMIVNTQKSQYGQLPNPSAGQDKRNNASWSGVGDNIPGGGSINGWNDSSATAIGERGLRQPTINNPFMNLQIQSYDTPAQFNDYNRYASANRGTDAIATEQTVNELFTRGLFQDSGDTLFDRNNSQRQFYSVNNGSPQNSQAELANWLYSTPGNCKAGNIWNRYGVKWTEDSLLCTGFNAASPTNFGKLGD